jgi:hypothetical protein
MGLKLLLVKKKRDWIVTCLLIDFVNKIKIILRCLLQPIPLLHMQ